MAIGSGTGSFDAFRRGTGRDHVDGHVALNSPGRYQLGGKTKEHVGRPGARIPNAISMIEEHKGWIRAALAESDVFGALADEDLNRLIGQGRPPPTPAARSCSAKASRRTTS
jgi:hypothetical protein